MSIIVKTPAGTWKSVIRKTGFPTTVKTFRLKRDAEDWARTTEDEMVRGLYVKRAPSERLTFEAAMRRYLLEVTPTKRPFTQQGEKQRSVPLVAHFGKYALAGISSELVAAYRDSRLAGEDRVKDGKPRPRAQSRNAVTRPCAQAISSSVPPGEASTRCRASNSSLAARFGST